MSLSSSVLVLWHRGCVVTPSSNPADGRPATRWDGLRRLQVHSQVFLQMNSLLSYSIPNNNTMALQATCSVLPVSMQRKCFRGAVTVPAPAARPKALCCRTLPKTLRSPFPTSSATSSSLCAELWPQAAAEANPTLLLCNNVVNEQPEANSANLQAMGLHELKEAFKRDTAAVESAGPLLRSLVDWAEAVEVEELLGKSATAVEDVQKSFLPGSKVWLAERARRDTAEGFAYHVLQALNDGNCTEGLWWERLPHQLQCPVFHALQQLGCVNGWGLPRYRPLPATAAVGNLVPGQRASLDLQQYIMLKTLDVSVVHDELHDTWDGRVEIYIHQQQLVNCCELAKALDTDILARIVSSSREGLALQLFKTAKQLGIGQAAAAFSAGTKSVRCLHELLLLNMHDALHAVSNRVILHLQRSMQPYWHSMLLPLSAANHSVNVLTGGHSINYSSSQDVATSSADGCGGSGRGKGSLTAVGADDMNGSAVVADVVPGPRKKEHDSLQMHVIPLVCETSAVDVIGSGQGSSIGSRGISWLPRSLSVFKRWRNSH